MLGLFIYLFIYKGKILTIPLWIIISSTKLPPFGESLHPVFHLLLGCNTWMVCCSVWTADTAAEYSIYKKHFFQNGVICRIFMNRCFLTLIKSLHLAQESPKPFFFFFPYRYNSSIFPTHLLWAFLYLKQNFRNLTV